jgi:DNA-binding Xre family transcriptional regulator
MEKKTLPTGKTYLNPQATGMKIWRLLDQKNLKPIDLKDEFNVTVQAIYKWLWGKSFPNLQQLVKLAVILEVNLNDLLVIE